MSSRRKVFSTIDLFAGCGGMSLGFSRAGFKIIGTIELDPQAVRTHALNFFPTENEENNVHATPRDITRTTPETFMREVLKAEEPEGLVDAIIGGPPCQAFARIGRAKLREIMNHPEAFLQDDRASLYLHFLRYVDFFRPKVVVMENVPDIMNFGGQNVAEEIATSLDSAMDYNVRYTILNAAFYGVPQMRQRFFLIAFRRDLNIEPEFPPCTHYIELPQGYENAQMVALGELVKNIVRKNNSHYVDPPKPHKTLPKAVSAFEAMSDLPPIDVTKLTRGTRKFDTLARYRDDIPPSPYALEMRTWPGFESDEGVYDHVTRYLPRDYKIFKRMKPGDQYPEAYALALTMFQKALDEYEKRYGFRPEKGTDEYERLKKEYIPPYDPGKFPNKWRKMEPDMPARTLTAHIGKDTYSHIHYDSDQSRVISVREAARLQSFPDGFKFSGAMNAAFRQIGNAVPPLLAYAIAKHIRKLLEKAEDARVKNNDVR